MKTTQQKLADLDITINCLKMKQQALYDAQQQQQASNKRATCSICEQELEVNADNFYWNKTAKRFATSYCKKCQNHYAKLRYAAKTPSVEQVQMATASASLVYSKLMEEMPKRKTHQTKKGHNTQCKKYEAKCMLQAKKEYNRTLIQIQSEAMMYKNVIPMDQIVWVKHTCPSCGNSKDITTDNFFFDERCNEFQTSKCKECLSQ
jgi:hypothetical protein